MKGWTVGSSSTEPQISVTLDGAANDGRPGEGDDVRDVENLTSHVSGTVTMGDANDFVDMWANLDEGRSTIWTRGGNDRIRGGNAEETVDAGKGDDRIEGGFGNDSIVAGPGRDTVFADKTGGNCGLFESCDVPVGNDLVDTRDSEVDSVDCGVGTDRALVDAIDVVPPNCEAVEKAAAAPAPAQQQAAKPRAKAGARLVLSGKALRASTVRRRGLTLRLAGARPGRAKFTVTIRSRRVAAKTVKVGSKGTATVRLRIGAKGRRLVRRGAKLTVRGAGTSLTIKLR